MDLSKIKAVVVDDDVFKGSDIRKALEFNGIKSIMTVRNQEKLWEQICRGEDKIGLIVTDMQYPLGEGEAVDEEAGLKLIERMEKEKIEIPVIVCSSLNYRIPNILGSRLDIAVAGVMACDYDSRDSISVLRRYWVN